MNAIVHPPTPLTPAQQAQRTTFVNGLTDALRSERRLIDELVTAMHQQREAVAADDLASIDDSVFAVQRILLTLGEARKRRRTLNERLGQPGDLPLRDLIAALGPSATEELRVARDDLQVAAQRLARDVATNRQILREALATGEETVRSLAGAAAPRVGYGEKVGANTGAQHASYLVNRRA
ncbi:MAG: flagellar export chaperone FlgN [Gemmatimonadaceae bacterium]|nr:flagellar export chaperone FlgN [Gemmatimonadaceae bacterium]